MRRQEALDDLGRQVDRARLEVQQAREAVLAQREQADAREVEIRQVQLAVELEQQELAGASAALARAQDELDELTELSAGGPSRETLKKAAEVLRIKHLARKAAAEERA